MHLNSKVPFLIALLSSLYWTKLATSITPSKVEGWGMKNLHYNNNHNKREQCKRNSIKSIKIYAKHLVIEYVQEIYNIKSLERPRIKIRICLCKQFMVFLYLTYVLCWSCITTILAPFLGIILKAKDTFRFLETRT